MTKVALIGAGGVAQRHARVLSGIDGVEVVAVADLSAEAAAALAETVGARSFADAAEALDATSPDAAYVCVPPFAHGAAEEAVLERGLPLFVEKPVGLDLAVVDRIEALVEKAGVVTGTGYHWRCLSHLDVAREVLSGTRPLLAHGWWLDKRPPVAWWQRRDASGGQVVEQLAHVLDLARFLLGDAVEAHAVGSTVDAAHRLPGSLPQGVEDTDVDDATAGLIRFASGAVMTITASCALKAKFGAGLDIVAPGAHLRLGEDALTVDRGDGDPVRHEPTVDPREAVDVDFIAAVRGERPAAIAPYADATQSHRLAMALAESATTGAPVQIPSRGSVG